MAQILTETGRYGSHWLRCRGCEARHEMGAAVIFSCRYRWHPTDDVQRNRRWWNLPAHYDSASDPEHERIREWLAAHAACEDAHVRESAVAGVRVTDRRRWR